MTFLPLPPVEKLIPYPTEAGHWYDHQGNPVYEVKARNGSMRPTTLRDARKLNLVPSVTGIERIRAKPALENWKREQLLMSALTLPDNGETIEDRAARIIKDAEEQSIKARDIGTAIHGAIEQALLGEAWDVDYNKHVSGALAALEEWCGLSDLIPEKSFAHELGYGGKCDVHKKAPPPGFVADFKSKEFTANNLPKLYDSHDIQLAAYREGFGMPNARCAIIFVSTLVPGLTHTIEVDEEDLFRGWNIFQLLTQLWQLQNRYKPNFD